MLIWLQFGVCLALIGFAGFKLSLYGDAIAEKTGFGGTWIGLVLLASVTSLPELATGVSSVTVADAPNIAVGDVLGSCVFNLLIIVILDMMHGRTSVFVTASRGHILSAAFGVMLLGVVGFNILLASTGISISMGHVGAESVVIIMLYAVAMRIVFRYERQQLEEFIEAEEEAYGHLSLRKVVARYAMAAAAVVAAGVWLPFVAKGLAEQMDWHTSFVGTLFVAFVTSLPEIAVTLSALKLGAVNMAVGNLFGSNLFNVAILGVDDLLYTQGPLLAHISLSHAVSSLSAIMMTGVAIVGLVYRPTKKRLKIIGWASLLIFSIYLVNSYIFYLYSEQ